MTAQTCNTGATHGLDCTACMEIHRDTHPGCNRFAVPCDHVWEPCEAPMGAIHGFSWQQCTRCGATVGSRPTGRAV